MSILSVDLGFIAFVVWWNSVPYRRPFFNRWSWGLGKYKVIWGPGRWRWFENAWRYDDDAR